MIVKQCFNHKNFGVYQIFSNQKLLFQIVFITLAFIFFVILLFAIQSFLRFSK
jgi:hypothetical protein